MLKTKWVKKVIKTGMNKRDKMYKAAAALNRCEENWNSLLNQRRKTKKKIRHAIRKYEFNIAEKCKENPRVFYSYIGNKKKVEPSIGPYILKVLNIQLMIKKLLRI